MHTCLDLLLPLAVPVCGERERERERECVSLQQFRPILPLPHLPSLLSTILTAFSSEPIDETLGRQKPPTRVRAGQIQAHYICFPLVVPMLLK